MNTEFKQQTMDMHFLTSYISQRGNTVMVFSENEPKAKDGKTFLSERESRFNGESVRRSVTAFGKTREIFGSALTGLGKLGFLTLPGEHKFTDKKEKDALKKPTSLVLTEPRSKDGNISTTKFSARLNG